MRPGRLSPDDPLEILARSKLQEKTAPESQAPQPTQQQAKTPPTHKPLNKPTPRRWG